MKNRLILLFLVAVATCVAPILAQQTAPPKPKPAVPGSQPTWPEQKPEVADPQPAPAEQKPAVANATTARTPVRRLTNYLLGPGDEFIIMSVQAPEITTKPIRVGSSGDFTIPMVGRVEAAGKTVDQLQTEIEQRLRTYIKEPDVAINLTQLRSQPVSVMGSVGAPGVHQLEGMKTLVEVLSLAGGVKPDGGSRVIINRKMEWGKIPLPSARVDGDSSVAEVNVRSIENGTNPAENIEIMPNDIITVPKADLVYVIGEGVRQPGAFTLSDRKGISVIQALARAQGQAPSAGLRNAKIVRPEPGGNIQDIPINLDAVLKRKATDVMLQPDDILYVPKNEMKSSFRRTLDTIVQMTAGVVIYR